MTNFFTTVVLSNHQVGLVICRALHTLGSQPETELKKLLIPRFEVDPNKDYVQWLSTVVVLKRSTMINEVNGELVLSNSLKAKTEIDYAIFAQEFMRGLTAANLSTIENGDDPDDLFKGLLWLTTLPSGHMIKNFAELYDDLKDFGFEKLVENNTQWPPFRRWARGLGYMRPVTKEYDCVDLSEIVHGIIRDLPTDGPLISFVEQLSEVIPLLTNEKLNNWYFKTTNFKRNNPQIDAQVGWALYKAEKSKMIEFYTEDDTKVTAVPLPLGSNGDNRLFTHVRKVV